MDDFSIFREVDMGGEDPRDSGVLATQALQMMVVATNESWKLPLSYHFICGLDGKERANLVKLALDRYRICSYCMHFCKSNNVLSGPLRTNLAPFFPPLSVPRPLPFLFIRRKYRNRNNTNYSAHHY